MGTITNTGNWDKCLERKSRRTDEDSILEYTEEKERRFLLIRSIS